MRALARLGEVVHLNGALPRDVPPADADPRPCRGCTGRVFRPGFRYCDACRRARCPDCRGRDGRHNPCCTRQTAPRPCRACGTPAVVTPGARYCAACKAVECPECRHFGGRHGDWCRYDRRRRRGTRPPGVSRGVVTESDVLGIFLTMRSKAVRTARAIVGDAWAEDVAHDVFLYLLERRDELREVPSLAYVMTAARRRAYQWKRPLVRARALAVDPAELVHLEAMWYALEHGRPRTAMVALADAEPAPA